METEELRMDALNDIKRTGRLPQTITQTIDAASKKHMLLFQKYTAKQHKLHNFSNDEQIFPKSINIKAELRFPKDVIAGVPTKTTLLTDKFKDVLINAQLELKSIIKQSMEVERDYWFNQLEHNHSNSNFWQTAEIIASYYSGLYIHTEKLKHDRSVNSKKRNILETEEVKMDETDEFEEAFPLAQPNPVVELDTEAILENLQHEYEAVCKVIVKSITNKEELQKDYPNHIKFIQSCQLLYEVLEETYSNAVTISFEKGQAKEKLQNAKRVAFDLEAELPTDEKVGALVKDQVQKQLKVEVQKLKKKLHLNKQAKKSEAPLGQPQLQNQDGEKAAVSENEKKGKSNGKKNGKKQTRNHGKKQNKPKLKKD